ncbi:MAG: hypothetical protein BRD37_05200, partial [Bacteroidetes bacterium QH_8_67_23]
MSTRVLLVVVVLVAAGPATPAHPQQTPADTLAAPADTLAPAPAPRDTLRVGLFEAVARSLRESPEV